MVNIPKFPDTVWDDKLKWSTYPEYNSYCFPLKWK